MDREMDREKLGSTSSYDIAIVGGGLVGLTLALALARSHCGLKIVVLEAKPQAYSWSLEGYDTRVSAITLASQRIFEKLKLWKDMQKKRVSPFRRMLVWEGEETASITFDSADIAEPSLGYIVENTVMLTTLLEHLLTCPDVQYVAPFILTQFLVDETSAILMAENGSFVRARLVVAADGATSWLRQEAKIAVDYHSYDACALVATVYAEKPHEQTARQIFLSTGPLAFLPLSLPQASSIVWTLPSQVAEQMLASDQASFCKALGQAFNYRLGSIIATEKRECFPLRELNAARYIAPRVALVGDAAHVVHPLAGQGVNIGLADALNLAEIIAGAIRRGSDFSSTKCLRRYERLCKAHNEPMLMSIWALQKLFAYEGPMLVRARKLGLKTINRIGPVKRFLMRFATGSYL